MKPARFVNLLWIGNAVLLAGAAALVWHAFNDAAGDRESHLAVAAGITTDKPHIQWRDDKDQPGFEDGSVLLSPLERPKPPQPKPPVEVEQPKPPKTDAELKAELERELNVKFKVMRLMLCNSPEYPDVAMLVSGSTRLQWFEGINLKTEYAKAHSLELRKFALDIKVLKIDEHGVLLNAPSSEKPDKRFDVLLPVQTEPSTMSVNAGFPDQGGALRIRDADPKRTEEALKDGDQVMRVMVKPLDEVDKNDYSDEAINELAKYAKAGKYGLEVLPSLPADSPARKYGARGGEIIKRVNGQDVKTMSDVRRVVRKGYDAGTREFKVEYERDGKPGERTFTVK
ncbi:MAG: hypothetical protein KDB82_08750 [Planctomycetes bacterium]|nr:hypothetical protein [Planctomycetota bacterium]